MQRKKTHQMIVREILTSAIDSTNTTPRTRLRIVAKLTAKVGCFPYVMLRSIHTKVQTDGKTLEKKFDLRLFKKYKDHWCCVPVGCSKAKSIEPQSLMKGLS